MLDSTQLREHSDELKKRLSDRIAPSAVEKVLKLDSKWRNTKTNLDMQLAKRNELSKKAKDDEGARKQVRTLKKEIELLVVAEKEAKKNFEAVALQLPNIPDIETPKGKDEKSNKIIREVGKKKDFSFPIRDYLSLGDSESLFGLHQATKASGARYAYIQGKAAKVEFALLQFAISLLSKKGFELVFPPTIIKKSTMESMGYLNQVGAQEVFHLQNPDEQIATSVLVGTAEQSLGGMCLEKTFSHKYLPKRYIACTPCYRREAGSYGKDTKGILRLHQFEKIEMFSITTPDTSREEHKFLLSTQEELVQKLELPYRVVDLAAGDLGLPSARTFDIEIFLPGQRDGKGEYRETHSTSNCTDFQARRLKAKFQNESGATEFVHTVNGTAIAMERMLIALMENYQTKEGDFEIPGALKHFFDS